VWVRAGAAAAVVVAALGCDSTAPPGPPSPRTEAVVSQLGGDPATVKSKVVRTEQGEDVRVTTFVAKPTAAQDVATLQSSCEAGTLDACTTLGNVRQSEGDYAGAEGAWKKACDGGVADACHELGNMLSNPFLQLGREPESVPLFQKACDLDHVAACYFLGGIHDRGQHGVVADPGKARALYERGCKNGHSWACKKVEVGQVASGGNCEWDACQAGLWCIQNVCTAAPG
jgi:TPR repeat protein